MIESITLNGVACFDYGNPQDIKLTKRVGIIYGLNGTGKSTITRFLANQSETKFQNCSLNIKAGTSPEIFVYNKDFIDRVFYDKDSIKGIFTIGEVDTTSEKIIESSQARISKVRKQIINKEEEISAFKSELVDLETGIYKDVWDFVIDHKGGVLDYTLKGYRNKKQKFFNALKIVEYKNDLDYDFDQLEEEILEITGDDIEKVPEINPIDIDFEDYEKDGVFSQKIVATDSSYLFEIISRLDNSDWVSKGKVILESEEYKFLKNDPCPFCQQDIPDGFISELENIFDTTYQQKKGHVQQIFENYKMLVDGFKGELESSVYKSSYVLDIPDYSIIKTKLIALLDRNLEKIKNKIENVSSLVDLESSKELLNSLNDKIEVANNGIKTFNKKIQSKDEVKLLIKNKFWTLVRSKVQSDIQKFDKKYIQLNDKIKALENYNNKALRIIDNLKSHIQNRKDRVTNISRSVEWINKIATSLGVIGFEIKETNDNSNTYQLVRKNDNVDVFKSLSEGEKTLITFLYFLEFITGSTLADGSVNLEERIIVIDDPISSLSHNYVYEVSSLIEHKIIRNQFGQILLFTHNLFFLHELLYQKRRKSVYDLFRIVKNKSSVIKLLKEKEIQNDYEGYWQSFKDIKESGNYLLAPIVMRNILENYFSFIKKRSDLSECIYELEKEYREYKPFLRYINKEAHSDINTLQDMGEIDPTRFFEIFKRIFEITHYEEHYYTMSGEEEVIQS